MAKPTDSIFTNLPNIAAASPPRKRTKVAGATNGLAFEVIGPDGNPVDGSWSQYKSDALAIKKKLGAGFTIRRHTQPSPNFGRLDGD